MGRRHRGRLREEGQGKEREGGRRKGEEEGKARRGRVEQSEEWIPRESTRGETASSSTLESALCASQKRRD